MTESVSFSEQWQSLLAESALLASAGDVLTGSDYVKQWGHRCSERAAELIDSGDIEVLYDEDTYKTRLAKALTNTRTKNNSSNSYVIFVNVKWYGLSGVI